MDQALPTSQPVETSTSLQWWNWTNLAGYIVNCCVTWLSLTGIFGPTNADLSRKYQALVTPAGWAFSIWGPIFIWEAVFVIAQMLPSIRGSYVARSMAPFWLFACLCQTGWTFAFAQEVILLSEVLMLCILVGLVGAAFAADLKEISTRDFWLLRAPISLHLGWIICASAVNTNVLAIFYLATPGTMLSVAIASLAAVASLASVYALAPKKADCFPGFVAAWALLAVYSELQSATNLLDPSKFNPYSWDPVVIQGFGSATVALSTACLAVAVVAVVRRLVSACRSPGSAEVKESSVP